MNENFEKLTDLIKKRVLIIAEIGCNHNGDVSMAKKLVEAAVYAGADAAKIQSFIPEEMITEKSPKAYYQIIATGTEESQFQRLKRMQLAWKEQEDLKKFCELKKIIFCSSPFDIKSADFLNKLDVLFFKIPSGEITNIPFLKYISSLHKPIILSTGMSNLGEVEDALNAIGDESRKGVILLHCLSDYPGKWKDANLKAMQTLKNSFLLPVGFSDHFEGYELSLVAAGMGAVVIEKHITLNKNMEGGDHRASLEPDEFKEMVEKIRKLEVALGDGIKRCMPSEQNVRDVARKSIVARRNINKGEIICMDDLSIKRPGNGISPKFINMIIGSHTLENITKDQLVSWSQLKMK
jgi:N-acetylneuraminate synthase